MKNRFPVFVFLLCAIFCAPAAAQTGNFFSGDVMPGKHRGAVTAVARDENGRILSAGEDGFLEIWNDRGAEERFQLSPYGIVSMVLRPGKPNVTVIESDGLGLYRVSAWDYEAKKNLFTLHFRDSISYINYSASGGFLIVARSGRTGAVFIHAETGELLESPEELSGTISFAATGRSERTMIVYLSSGVLSYWDLETGSEMQRFEVPPNINSPVLFGNNRFLGGFDSGGLLILDAVTGTILARDEFLGQGYIFLDNLNSTQFNCLVSSDDVPAIYRMEINLSGRLSSLGRRNVPLAAEVRCCAAGGGDDVILGTAQGTLWLLGRSGGRIMDTGNQVRVTDAAASLSALGFIAEDNALGYIPLDYSLLKQDDTLWLEDAENCTNIVPASSGNTGAGFLLWQDDRSFPVIKTLTGPPAEAASFRFPLDKLTPRFPFRRASVMGNSILLLDTAGTVSIVNRESGELRFTYSAAGAVDAAFIDEDTIILGRSAATGNTPFMTVNAATGETVSLAYPALVGVRVYRGETGVIYGASVSRTGETIQTSVIKLNISNPAMSERLIEFNGEDSSFTLAESGGNLASDLGGGAALLYRTPGGNQYIAQEMVSLERSSGLPVKIIDGGRRFIVLDEEGGITWHDNWTGRLLAVLRLYPDFWVLESNGQTIRGKLLKKQPA